MKRNRLLLFLLFLIGITPSLYAQSDALEQQPLTTVGTDFWIAFPHIDGTPHDDASLKILVMVSGEAGGTVVVENGRTGNQLGTMAIPANGGYAELQLSPNDIYAEVSEQVYQSVHIYARDGITPFSCFAQVETGQAGASSRDVTLLIPRKSLGYEYLVQTYPQDGKSTAFVVVATEDNTTVVITPSTTTYTGQPAGAPITYPLRKGQSVMVSSKQKSETSSDTLDLSGSLICADHPIAVYESNEAVNIPMKESVTTDYTFEQIPPIGSMGTKFFISRPDSKIQNMYCCVTALYDNTKIEQIRYNSISRQQIKTTINLSAGQSLATRPELNRIITDISIESSLPVLCYTYFSSAANNQEEGFDENFNTKTFMWGDPANAMVTAWEQRVSEMSFFTREMMTDKESDEQFHYLQVTVPSSDVSLLQLDGVNVDASLFKQYGSETTMSYATIPINGYGKHSLATTGEGFVGYVYGVSEGVAYLYTLGYRPDAHPDSLFIDDGHEIMSPLSYDLERMPQGWYQRQLIEWPEKMQRLDTALICDSTVLKFSLQSDRAYTGFIWEVWQLDKKGEPDSLIKQELVATKDPIQNWEHQFLLYPDKEHQPPERDPFTEYIVYSMMQRPRIVCPEDEPLMDTLRTVVRVMRSYNDTVQKIMCSSDSTYFFLDSLYADAPGLSYTGQKDHRDSTLFVGDTIACKRGKRIDNKNHVVKLGLGEHYITRKYETRNGCDSIVTFAVFVCPSPDTTWVDTLLLHDRTRLVFPNKENTMFAGRTITTPGVYMDRLIGSHCDCPNIVDSTFVGCDSVIVMRVQLRDTLVVNFCDSTDNPKLYGVNWREYNWAGHSNFPSIADSVIVGQTREFHDYYTTADGLDSCYTLIITREPVTVEKTIVDWPNNRPYVWKWGDAVAPHFDTIRPQRDWLDYTVTRNRRVTYSDGSCPTLYHLEVTFKETYFTTRDIDICDIDTAVWRGHIFAGSKWRETYPNPNFTPQQVLTPGVYEICVDSFRTVVLPARDSLFYFNINVHATYHEYDTIHICDNEVINYNGKYFAGSKAVTSLPLRHRLGAKEDMYMFDSVYVTPYGCDSVCSAVFYQHPSYQMPVEKVTICADSSFVWRGHSDTDRPMYDAATGKVISFGKGNLWRNSTNTTFTIIDSLRTVGCADCRHGGCDSIHTLQLTVNPVYGPFVLDTTVCRSKYNFEWVGHPDRNNPGQNLVFDKDTYNYYDTLKTVGCDCDSIFVLNLTFFDDAPRTYDTAVCHNAEPFLMGTTGVYFSPKDSTLGLHISTHDVYLTEAQHCPYIETWNVTVYPDYSGMTNDAYCLYDTICRDTTGNYYVWDDHYYADDSHTSFRTLYRANGTTVAANRIDITRPGNYLFYDSLTTTTCVDCAHGCDSVWVLRLTVLPSYYHEFRYMMSDEETYTWEGITYGGVQTKTSFDQLVTKDTIIESHHALHTGTYDCDSTVMLYLRVGRVYRDTTYDFVCDNCYYQWFRYIDDKDSLLYDSLQVPANQTLYYYDRYETVLGYDSIFVLALTGMPTYHFEKTDTVCQYNGDYDWEGHFTPINHFYIKGLSVTNIPIKDTGWVYVTDSIQTQSLFTDPHGVNSRMTLCDSIWSLRLYVAPVYDGEFHTNEVTTSDILCSNETYLWERTLFVGHDYDNVANPLSANPALYDSIVVLTKDMYDATGKYHFLMNSLTVLGCDSTRFLHLYVAQQAYTMLYDTIGDNNTTWSFGHGKNRVTGKDFHVEDYTVVRDVRKYFFIDTLQTSNGCDSIIHDSLLVVPTYRFEESAVTCSGVTFNWRKYFELNKYNSGYYYDSLYTTEYGADSTYVLNLTIVPNFHSEQTKQMCKNDTIYWHYKKIFYETWNEGDLATTYHVEYVRPGACDSLYDMYMFYYDYYHFAPEVDSVCQYDTYHWYTNGIEHTTALRDEKGNKLTAIPTDTTGWITIYDSLKTSSPCHCDSTFTLRLYVRPAFYYHDSTTICSNDTFYWHDRAYNSPKATILRDTIPLGTGLGCDSIYYLKVNVNQAYFFDETDIVCGSELPYTWTNHKADIPIPASQALLWDNDSVFVLWDSCHTVMGCDSIYRRVVTVKPIRHDVLYDTICSGDVLQYHWHQLTSAGTYTDTLVNQFGCDSMVTLILSLVQPTQFALNSEPVICGDDKAFDLSFTSTGIAPLAYCVKYNDKEHEQRFEDIAWTVFNDNQRVITLSLPAPMSSVDYPVPNDYSGTVYFDNGYCLDSSLLALPFSFRILYPSWLIEQHWNDAIGLLTDSLNGGYHFIGFQWYKNNTLMPGETKPYLYCPQYLDADATYSLALTRQTDSLTFMTCPIVPDLNRPQELTPSQPYISVVPTVVVRENPVVNILCVNGGNYEIYDAFGVLLSSGVYLPGLHNAYEVTLPASSGVYIFHLHDSALQERTIKVVVQ